jgi:hypothetical protein
MVVLAAGVAGQEPPGPDHGVLFVDVLPAGDARCREGRLPILYGGRLPRDLAELREWLREDADPLRYPAIRRPDGTAMPRFPEVEGVPPYPSDRILRIRCARDREHGWALAVMQICSTVPGRAPEAELKLSPLIWRIELGILATERWVPAWLPRDRPLAEGSPAEEAEIRLLRPAPSLEGPFVARDPTLSARGRKRPFGRLRECEAEEDDGPASGLRWEPPDSLERLERWLANLKRRHPEAQVKLKADPRSCFGATFEILETFRAAGFPHVAFAQISAGDVDGLIRGSRR